MTIWNPWHGCKKLSPGCANCYVYRRDESIGKDASIVTKTNDYNLPLKKNRQKEYKVTPEDGVVYTCMTSDFFLEEADEWRQGCWDIIRERSDLEFCIITKRKHRNSLPTCMSGRCSGSIRSALPRLRSAASWPGTGRTRKTHCFSSCSSALLPASAEACCGIFAQTAFP